MTSVTSIVNSSSTPLTAGQVWNGPIESCRNYTLLTISIYSANTDGRIDLYQYDKLGTQMYTSNFTYGVGTNFRQYALYASHFAIKNTSTSGANQTTGKLIAKLSNNMPEDMTVKLSSDTDFVTAKLQASSGVLSSINESSIHKLYVKQNVLAATTDGVLGYGLEDGTSNKIALKVNSGGVLSTSSVLLTTSNFCSTSVTHTPQQVVGSAKRVMRMNCFNSGAQVAYIRLHNMATEPVNTNVPVLVFTVPQAINFNVDIGVNFTTGVYVTASSNAGKVTSFGTVGGDEVSVNIAYE